MIPKNTRHSILNNKKLRNCSWHSLDTNTDKIFGIIFKYQEYYEYLGENLDPLIIYGLTLVF